MAMAITMIISNAFYNFNASLLNTRRRYQDISTLIGLQLDFCLDL